MCVLQMIVVVLDAAIEKYLVIPFFLLLLCVLSDYFAYDAQPLLSFVAKTFRITIIIYIFPCYFTRNLLWKNHSVIR